MSLDMFRCSYEAHVCELCCRFSPQRVACLRKGEIDIVAIEQQAVEAASRAVPAWESYAVVPGTEDPAEKRQRVV